MTDDHSVSRRKRALWYLSLLNRTIELPTNETNDTNSDINLISVSSNGQNNSNLTTSGNLTPTNSSQSISATLILPQDDQTASAGSLVSKNPAYHISTNTRVLFLASRLATLFVLDISPSVISVDPQSNCVLLDVMFDTFKKSILLLIQPYHVSSDNDSNNILTPDVHISVITYSPFLSTKCNQVLCQNRGINSYNVEQFFVEVWLGLERAAQEIHELISTITHNNNQNNGTLMPNEEPFLDSCTFNYPVVTNNNNQGDMMRQSEQVIEDIFNLGLISLQLMPELSKLSMIIITDGLFAATNDLSDFRQEGITCSFISLGCNESSPDSSFGYMPYVDFMKFVAKTTSGVFYKHDQLINCLPKLTGKHSPHLLENPLFPLFCYSLYSGNQYLLQDDTCLIDILNNHYLVPYYPSTRSQTPLESHNKIEEAASKYFKMDQPSLRMNSLTSKSEQRSLRQSLTNGLFGSSSVNSVSLKMTQFHDWRTCKQLDRNLEAEFEQVLSCRLHEGYVISNISFKRKETNQICIVLVLPWKHNMDIEYDITSSFWFGSRATNAQSRSFIGQSNQSNDPDIPNGKPTFGEPRCEVIVHGSYSFLHNLYCGDNRVRRKCEFRELAYQQFRQLFRNILISHERLQYLYKFYREPSLSKVPTFLIHGNSLLYEQPHTNKLTSTIENADDESRASEFQQYWQDISCLDIVSWKNYMHVHDIRLVLEHDQPKQKYLHHPNVNGRYTHVQCRRAFSVVSNFIKNYASFSLLEDKTYIKIFLQNPTNDGNESVCTSNSYSKGFITIRITKQLPILIVHLLFTNGINDAVRFETVKYLEENLNNCRIRNSKSTLVPFKEGILSGKTLPPSSNESACYTISSPIESMLKRYNRNFINDYLLYNWAYGLPGFYQHQCNVPFNIHRQQLSTSNNQANSTTQNNSKASLSDVVNTIKTEATSMATLPNTGDQLSEKYLYGLRLIRTISGLPHRLVPLLASTILSKILSTLVNIRIKQGFHIAFNDSGIMNLLVELKMIDPTNEKFKSTCLAQYVIFPPIISSNNQSISSNINLGNLSGSLTNANCQAVNGYSDTQSILSTFDDLMHDNRPDFHDVSCPTNEVLAEFKLISEYWIEPQYGLSSTSNNYHTSLSDLRYFEFSERLCKSEMDIVDCLLTHEFLHLLCDRSPQFSTLDRCLLQDLPQTSSPIYTGTNKSSSIHLDSLMNSSMTNSQQLKGSLSSSLMDISYKFSVVNFLRYCQQTSVSLVLFKNSSIVPETGCAAGNPVPSSTSNQSSRLVRAYTTASVARDRKMSFESNEEANASARVSNQSCKSRPHRSSYQHDYKSQASNNSANNLSMYYHATLDQLFLDLLGKGFKQYHDKEFELTPSDSYGLPAYLLARLIDFDLNNVTIDGYKITNPPRWKCYIKKTVQGNLILTIIPSSIEDIQKWSSIVESCHLSSEETGQDYEDGSFVQIGLNHNRQICPIIIYRCSSAMLSDKIFSDLSYNNSADIQNADLPAQQKDSELHFGRPCKYLGIERRNNDELGGNELLFGPNESILTADEDTTGEVVNFRAYIKKIRSIILKSRLNSLNDAYTRRLFIDQQDLVYYVNNTDFDLQRKCIGFTQLKSVTDFIKSFEDFMSTLPKELDRPSNPMLNSILLQKCGLFLNQPITRLNQANPLLKQINDQKLLHLIKSNYTIDLPFLDEAMLTGGGTNLLMTVTSNRSNVSRSSKNNSNNFMSTTATSNTIHVGSLGAVSSSKQGSQSGSNTNRCSSIGNSPVTATGALSMNAHMAHSHNSSSFSSPDLLHQNGHRYIGNNSQILEAFRGIKPCRLADLPKASDCEDMVARHEAHLREVLRIGKERDEANEFWGVLNASPASVGGGLTHNSIDRALRHVDSLGRLEHFCLTPLLFSPSWRSKLAPVRDHTLEKVALHQDQKQQANNEQANQQQNQSSSGNQINVSDDAWHQTVCNNYIQEYVQYLQTLGFGAIQFRQQQQQQQNSTSYSTASTTMMTSSASEHNQSSSTKRSSRLYRKNRSSTASDKATRRSSQASASQLSSSNTTNTGYYLIKFLNSGCLVFKVGFCEPYVYSNLYSIEGGRYNNISWSAKDNMTTFLDELDKIKVTMHLHSFTYDYHLRSIYSYISGRQLTFRHGYHLISFLDDFRKYYQKAPNYARNHIMSGQVTIDDILVTGQQLYNYIISHNPVYRMDVLRMVSTLALGHNSNPDNSYNLKNDYVLIELSQDRVQYKDSKDFDIFDCGLLITHDTSASPPEANCLTLKYFLLLTSQRELYPKLIYSSDNILSLGSFKPIRFGSSQIQSRSSSRKSSLLVAAPNGQNDKINGSNNNTDQTDNSDNDNSIELSIHSINSNSGPASITTTTSSSVHTNSSTTLTQATATGGGNFIELGQNNQSAPQIQVEQASMIVPAAANVICKDNGQLMTIDNTPGTRSICDEEITYLGYFSAYEIDMLEMLKQKTLFVQNHIRETVKAAEIHYHRDYLWHKLMQRPSTTNTNQNSSVQSSHNSSAGRSDSECSLSNDDFAQLLSVVNIIKLHQFDKQLVHLSSLHISWYGKLMRAFSDLKSSNINRHRIFVHKRDSKCNLIYIDPRCASAFVLLVINSENSSTDLMLVMKDLLEGSNKNGISPNDIGSDCQQLVEDFVNFCASFMWVSFV